MEAEELPSLLDEVMDALGRIATNCQGCAVCDGDPGGGHEMNYHIAVGAKQALGRAIDLANDENERFLLAYVSHDTKVIGIEHSTEAPWDDVLNAHIALRDRLNVRIAEQKKCPRKPPATSAGAAS